MAFSNTIVSSVMANKKVKMGTFTGTGVTSGTIETGLNYIDTFLVNQGVGTGVSAYAITGGSVALTFTSGDTGHWMAVGA